MGCSACLGNTLKGLLLPFSVPPNTHQLPAVQHRSFSFRTESLISVFNALLASTGYEVRLTVFLGISSLELVRSFGWDVSWVYAPACFLSPAAAERCSMEV